MKITSPKTNRFIPIAIGIIIITCLSVGAYFFWPKSQASSQPKPVNSVDYQPATQEQKDVGSQIKQESLAKNGNETQDPTSKPSITISIAGQAGRNKPLSIRTLVDGNSGGKCNFKLTKEGQPDVSMAFDIKTEASTRTCNGDIPAESFAEGGDWKLEVSLLYSDNMSVSAPAKLVSIEKGE
jgi:hypothetical protein